MTYDFLRSYKRSRLCYSVAYVCRLSSITYVLWLNGTSYRKSLKKQTGNGLWGSNGHVTDAIQ